MTAPVVVHPIDPAEGMGAPYTVQVNGQRIPLERVGVKVPVYYARYSGPVEAKVKVSIEAAGEFSTKIKPEHLAREVRVEGRQVTFSIQGPGPRLVFLKTGDLELPRLLIIAEPAETDAPDPSGSNVLNILDYGVIYEPVAQTVKIQKALDDCAAKPGGGIVYVPPGKYYTGTLRVRDNTHLYLAGGAVLQMVDDPAACPPDQPESGDPGVQHSFSRLLLFDRAKHSRLSGRGTLDANGWIMRKTYDRRIQVVDVTDSHDIQIEGVVLRHPGSWSLHILHSDNVRVADVKIITDWQVPNGDGVDPDSSQEVLIERTFFYCGDDAVAVKTTNNSGLLRPVDKVVVRDSVITTKKTALKIGTETRAEIRNVLFENIDVVHSSRGLAIWARDGGTLSDITWRNIRMDLVEVPGEDYSGQPFLFTINPRLGTSTIRNVRVRDIVCRAPYCCPIESMAADPISGVTFENVKLTVAPRMLKPQMCWLFEFANASNIVFNDLLVDWTDATPHWHGLWPPEAPVKAQKVNEVGKK